MYGYYGKWFWYFGIVGFYQIFAQQGGQNGGGPNGGKPDDNCVCIMESAFSCDSDACHEYLNLDDLTVKKVDESTTQLIGAMGFLKGMEDPTKVTVKIEKCDGGYCKIAMTHEIKNFCDEIDNEDSPYHSQLMNIALPKCPIPPGIILFEEVELDTSNLPVNQNYQGRYKATMTLSDGNSGQELAMVRFGFEIDCD